MYNNIRSLIVDLISLISYLQLKNSHSNIYSIINFPLSIKLIECGIN